MKVKNFAPPNNNYNFKIDLKSTIYNENNEKKVITLMKYTLLSDKN